MKFVADCSPLIFLAKLDVFDLLNKDEILITFEVQEELLIKESPEKDKIVKFLSQKNVKIAKVLKPDNFSEVLGKGELSTINLALEKKIPNVLMDDRRARSLAKIRNLKPRGTLWLILRAYKNGLLNKTQTHDLIYDLPSIGFRIDQEFLFTILKNL
ncbi:hypothetical protein HY604_01575 [Candidatus Peregrinibacteria bacterium]|nr:hypothetical protein [Candidatus Peregrinibacteria bacterium]